MLSIYNLQEGKINFLPTYKFDPKTKSYIFKKKSKNDPSWRDRILFKNNSEKINKMELLEY